MNTKMLEIVVRDHGYAKVAYEVMRVRGEYVPRDGSLAEHITSLTTKVAQNRLAHRKIRAGLEALGRVAGA